MTTKKISPAPMRPAKSAKVSTGPGEAEGSAPLPGPAAATALPMSADAGSRAPTPGATVLGQIERLSLEIFAFQQKACDDYASGVRMLLGCRTVDEIVAVQQSVLDERIAAIVGEASRLADIAGEAVVGFAAVARAPLVGAHP
jgi:hypothetical protein